MEIAVRGELLDAPGSGTTYSRPRDSLAASLRRTLGSSSALRVLVSDAVGRLATTAMEGSWPEEADTVTVARRRTAFESGTDTEITLLSPPGMVLLMLPLVDGDEGIGIVEIVAAKAAVAENRHLLPAFVEAITTQCRRPRPPEAHTSGHANTNGDGRAPYATRPATDPATNGHAMPRVDAAGVTDLRGVRFLLVDRHKLFADALRNVLEEMGAEVLPPVHEAADALAAARKSRPDLVLIDLAIGPLDTSGTTLGQDLLRECPNVKVVGFSAVADTRGAGDSIRSGFHGCLTKDLPLDQFVGSLRATLQGECVQTCTAGTAVRELPTADQRHAAMLSDHLTRREREVLCLLVEGATGQQMARKLSASPNTIRTHIQSVLTKLQVHSRLEAATFAVRNGLVRIPAERR